MGFADALESINGKPHNRSVSFKGNYIMSNNKKQEPVINNRLKYTTVQQRNLDKFEGNSNYRLEMGRNRLREMVGWVFTAMPLIAPLPNVVGLIMGIGAVLGGGAFYITAALIAVSIELMLFGVSEQLNGVIDKWLRADAKDKRLYWMPMGITGVGAIAIVVIMMSLVYTFEVAQDKGHPVMLTLPLISVLSVGFMGARSYMAVLDGVRDDEVAIAQDAARKVQMDNAQLNGQIDVDSTTNTVQFQENVQSIDVQTVPTVGTLNNARVQKANAQMDNLMVLLRTDYMGHSTDDLNKAELGRRMGMDRRTVGRYLNVLTENGSLNGVVA